MTNATSPLFAERFDADGLFYVFDDRQGGSQVAGPFTTFDEAEREAQRLRPGLSLTIADHEWEPIGPEDEGESSEERHRLLWSRILYRPDVRINGVGFHLEGWAVEYDEDEHRQIADYDDDSLGQIHHAVGADGTWDTVMVNDREYVLIMSPYC